MRLFRILRQRARSIFRGAKLETELENELAFHLEQLTRENIAAGMDAREARFAARRTLGGVALLEDQCRDQRRINWLTDLRKDLIYAWRMVRKSPAFTAIAVVTLALGVGASIAIYTIAEGLLLRSLPFPSPDTLVSISDVHVREGASGVGQENFRDWQASNNVFERMAFTEFSQTTLTGLGEPERITGRSVSEGFFEMLNVPPALGRWFAPSEQPPGRERVILLSHGLWIRKFGARPDVVGSTIFLNDRPYRITGVMPEGFRFNEGDVAEYWAPISYRSSGRQQHQYSAYARLRPGVTVEAAQAQMSEIARRLERTFHDNAGWGVRVISLRSEFLRLFGPALLIFAAAALIVLLVACGNIASLLLARGIGRAKEVAVRMALGAGRQRVVRLFLTESLLLSGMGALAGIVLAYWLIRLVILATPPWLQLETMISVSPTVVLFSVSLTLCTGLLTGLWPALRGARIDLQNDLKESGNSLVAGRQQMRALNSLVVMEIALAVVLLTFAGLLSKSFAFLLHTNLGYHADHLLTFRMPLPSSRYKDDPARLQFWNTLLPRIGALPGVTSVSAADSIPLGGTYSGVGAEIAGQPSQREWRDAMVRGASITPEYFRTLGIAIRGGRSFDERDLAGSEPVAIVNESFVRKLMHGQSPLGTLIRFEKDKWRRVVGVIEDTRYNGPTSKLEPELYVPFTQDAWLQFVAIRTAVPEETLLGAVRETIRQVDPGLPISQVRSMTQSVSRATSLQREMMTLVVGFAAVTLAMATLGLGGVMAYTVSRRRREIGLRMALGARATDVARAVIHDAARLFLAGSAIGVLCALAGTRLLQSVLHGVEPRDPAVIVAAPVVLGVIALMACLLPARRAASVDPITALRQE